ncbi:PEPxxWA-CTERM sorting domain-containing protein [Sphingomonas sp. RS6]
MRFAYIAAIAATLSAAPALAQTSETVEVVSGPTGMRAVTVAAYDPLGQSFTAFAQHLTSFGFQFEALNPSSANTPITYQLLAGEGFGGSVVTSGTFTLPDSINNRTATWFDFDLTGTDVVVGNRYTMVISTGSYRNAVVLGPEVNIYTGEVLGGDVYAGGTALFQASNQPYSGFCASSGTCDLNFRVSGYNDVASGVPEPASWAMMIGGIGLAGAARRRRLRVAAFA